MTNTERVAMIKFLVESLTEQVEIYEGYRNDVHGKPIAGYSLHDGGSSWVLKRYTCEPLKSKIKVIRAELMLLAEGLEV